MIAHLSKLLKASLLRLTLQGPEGGTWTWTWVCAWPRPFYAWGTVGTHLTMVNLPNP